MGVLTEGYKGLFPLCLAFLLGTPPLFWCWMPSPAMPPVNNWSGYRSPSPDWGLTIPNFPNPTSPLYPLMTHWDTKPFCLQAPAPSYREFLVDKTFSWAGAHGGIPESRLQLLISRDTNQLILSSKENLSSLRCSDACPRLIKTLSYYSILFKVIQM